MAKTSNNFIKGRMNKDLDDRLLPIGEYRNAVNTQISRSEGENVGALENTLGNSLVADYRTLTGVADLVSIGYLTDEVNNRIFSFLTDNTASPYQEAGNNNHYIYLYDALAGTSTELVTGAFLNFSTLYPITGINIIEDLLFWTDNRNQPRKINIDLAINGVGAHAGYYSTEDNISVARYNPYQSIDLYKRSSDLTNPTPDADEPYETTMYDVTSIHYPNGGTAIVNGTVDPASATIDVKSPSITGDILAPFGGALGATIHYVNPTTGALVDTGETVSTFNYSSGLPTTSQLVATGTILLATTDLKLVFNANPYYIPNYNGDKDFLRDKFIRFSYRYRYDDGEYSIMAPFTQDCFIPKQDGYFMYKVSQVTDNAQKNYKTAPPVLEIEDEEDTYRTTTVDFMENKVDKIILRIPLPSVSMALDFHVSEMDILYKESDGLAVYVIETIPVADIDSNNGSVQIDGTQTATQFDIFPANTWGNIVVGDQVTSDTNGEITDSPTLTAFNGTDSITLSTTQTLTNLDRVYFNDADVFEYEYQSTKPYKVLPSDEVTRTYDKVPVKALAQEVISNRIVYGNFQNKHTPPATLDYNVGVSEKTEFNLGTGAATIRVNEAIGQTVLSINTPTGVYNLGSTVTSSVVGAIPAGTTLVEYDSSGPTATISNALLVGLTTVAPDVLTFTAPSDVRYTTSAIEYPNSSLKTNRTYQVGVILSDRWGRSSTVVLSESDNAVNYNNINYLGSTVFTEYIDDEVNTLSWFGNSLKVLFNNTISPSGANAGTGWPGIYDSDVTSVTYNPLGWYSYKIVVKQTQQEYYNVYLPGVMAAYPTNIIKELGKTSHAVLINDNINKVPRDLTEVGPEQRQFRSSVNLHGRVENQADNDPGDVNKQFYPGIFTPIVSVIATDNDLFDGVNEVGYLPSPEFYNVASDPLIARINTPSGQFGIQAVVTQAEVSAVTGDDITLDIATLLPCGTDAVPSCSNCVRGGMTVSGNGIQPGTKVVGLVAGCVFKLDKTPLAYSADTYAEPIVFAPTIPYAIPTGYQYLFMPHLAIMETDPVESNLDIFWETTTTGLITDLNTAIINGTAASADLSSFTTTAFTEALNPGGSGVNIAADFSLVDQYSSTITWIDQNPPQLQLTSVLTQTGVEVGPPAATPLFTLKDYENNSYNVLLKDSVYYASNTAWRTYNFNFELNTFDTDSGAQVTSYVTKTAALINEDPSILAGRCTNVTYIPGTDGGGIGTIIALPGFNGAHDDLGSNAKEEISWTSIPITVVKDSINYGPGTDGLGYVQCDQATTLGTGRFYFAGNNPPEDMVDGVYACVATVEDAAGQTAECSFDLTINRTPCYTWEYVWTDTGNTIAAANYADCEGETIILDSFIDQTPGGMDPCANAAYYVCARDTAVTTGVGGIVPLGFVKLTLVDVDPCNTCNG